MVNGGMCVSWGYEESKEHGISSRCTGFCPNKYHKSHSVVPSTSLVSLFSPIVVFLPFFHSSHNTNGPMNIDSRWRKMRDWVRRWEWYWDRTGWGVEEPGGELFFSSSFWWSQVNKLTKSEYSDGGFDSCPRFALRLHHRRYSRTIRSEKMAGGSGEGEEVRGGNEGREDQEEMCFTVIIWNDRVLNHVIVNRSGDKTIFLTRDLGFRTTY